MSELATIVAPASGWGQSRWALLRVSGPAVGRLSAALLVPGDFKPRTVVAGGLRLGSGLLPCWAMRGVGPRTYTGEDALELMIPGNPLVIERVLACLCGFEGVREATPGEFSARAFLNGKLTLEQAEGVAATIAARTERQLREADRLISGQTGARYRAWAEELATLLALVEAGIDFTDQEDVVPIRPADLAERLERLRREIEGLLGGRAGLERRSALPRVVLAGRPNAGKSTLFNALLGRRRAVESPVEGTTRDVLEEKLDLSREIAGGDSVVLVDVAGLDQTLGDLGGMSGGHGIEGAGQSAAREAIEGADVVLYCDPTGRFNLELPSRADGRGVVIRVRTKADLLATGCRAGDSRDLEVCALDGWHLPVLKRAIADGVRGGEESASAEWVIPRHRRALAEAALCLAGAVSLVDRGTPALEHPETVADRLRAGLDAIGEVTGAISPDEVIGRVFATFCVGK